MTTFEDLGLSPQLLRSLDKLGFEEPTEIQELSIPAILEGKDVIGESATGSGKTFAFGLGVIEYAQPRGGVQALILTPTRELAEQVKDSLRKITRKLNVITVYGGVSIDPQIRDLRKAEIVVATPGRLLDHLDRGTIDLSKLTMFVLDEVDRMFDMGFIDDVERIISACPKQRQTLFFSATIAGRIKQLARKHMKDPLEVKAKNHVDPSKLKQVYYDVQRNIKLSLLVHLLKNEQSGLVMVFCNTRRTVDFVVKNLKGNRMRAIAIHGGLTQNKRTKSIKMFNDKMTGVLVCTDVAARGLHIDNVSHVYNYEIPNDPKEYVHRIGRTARAGSDGIVINLISDFDHQNFSRVMSSYREFAIEKLDRPRVERVQTIKVDDGRRRSFGNSGPRRGGPRGNSGFSRGKPRRARSSFN